MENLLNFGGLIFWGIVLLVSLLIVYSIETEDKQEVNGPTALLVISAGAFGFFYRVEFKSMFENMNWVYFFIGLFVYFVIGTFWMLFKWNQLCKRKYKSYLKIKTDNLKYFEITVLKDVEIYNKKLEEENLKNETIRKNHIPRVGEYKSSLTMWLFFFPFSMIIYFISKFFIDLRDWILKKFESLLNNISNKAFKPKT